MGNSGLIILIFTLIFINYLLTGWLILGLILRKRNKRSKDARVSNDHNGDFVKRTVYDKEMKEIENKINKLNESRNIDKSTNDKTQADVLKGGDEVMIPAETFPVETSTESKDVPDRSKVDIKYLKGKSEGEFNLIVNTKDDDINFCVEKISDIMYFKFCGNVEKALVNFDAIFDKVCDYEGDPNNATKIINIESGQVEKNDNGKWSVTKKAKIKVE